jgi:hypothetical protein
MLHLMKKKSMTILMTAIIILKIGAADRHRAGAIPQAGEPEEYWKRCQWALMPR